MKQQKKKFRKEVLTKRQSMTAEEHQRCNDLLCTNLKAWLQNGKFTQVFYFLPFRNEPDLVAAVNELELEAAGLPVIDEFDHSMVFRSWKPGEPLVENRYKIPEPSSSPILKPLQNTAILVPTLAMDRAGYRIGYGGGYYDRYLEKADLATSVGVLFHRFVFDKIPVEDHDRKLDFFLTDDGIHEV